MVKHRGAWTIRVSDDCAPDKVPLRFENGNIWWKPIEECQRVDALTAPRHAQQMKLRLRGYKLPCYLAVIQARFSNRKLP